MDLFKTIFHSGIELDSRLANSLLRLPHVVSINEFSETEDMKLKANRFLEVRYLPLLLVLIFLRIASVGVNGQTKCGL